MAYRGRSAMMAACLLRFTIMSSPPNTNPDGFNMTTPGEPGTMNNGRDIEASEGGLMTLDGQGAGTEVQSVTVFAEDVTEAGKEIGGDPLALDDPLNMTTSPEEVMMVIGVDPTTMSTNVSTDEAVLSESSGTPPKMVMTTPLTPIREFLSLDESTPGASSLEQAGKPHDASGVHDKEEGIRTRSRKVVGRKLAVVEDDEDTQSSMSMSSVGYDMMSTSSSKVVKKGIKRSRMTEDRNFKMEDMTEEESSDRRKKKRKGKRKAIKKDTEEEESDGKYNIRIGWTMARVELLKVRPLQCYRCWSFGHVQSACRSVIDRRGACFKCGQQGHVASACKNPVHCAVCHDNGLEASHRLGGPQCVAQVRHDALLTERRPFAASR